MLALSPPRRIEGLPLSEGGGKPPHSKAGLGGLGGGQMKHSPAFLKLVDEVKTRIREMTITDVKRKLDAKEGFILIDVREDSEWNVSRLPGANHLCKGIIERDIEKTVPDPNGEIVLYCGGGFRSALAADSLQKMGYKRVYSMAGGFRGWNEAGFPLDKS